MLKMAVARLSTERLILIPCPKCFDRQALPDKPCPTKLCPTSPPVKQKPDGKLQLALTSRGAVCSSAREHP
ncbi:hypothetical protein TB2_006473 [Malus domestica]